MSNPTSNFGWVLPTSTDLVTDLPADFEVALQGVDTTMADLKGGTTGQILSKATNTDMDFVWTSANPGDITGVTATSPLTGGGTSGDVTVGIQDGTTAQKGAVQLTNSVASTSTTTAAVPANVKTAYDLAAAAIATSTVTTAGDLIYRNATVPTRLGIGTAGQVLKVNTGATAPEWGSATAGAANWVQISSPTVTAASSLSFTGLSGYKQLRLLMQGTVSSVANATAKVRFNANAGATAYQFNIARMAANAYGGDTTSGPDDAIVGNQWILLNTSGLNCLSLDVNDSNGTGYKAYSVATQGTNGSSVQRTMFSGYGMFISTTAISSIDITLSSGTMTCNTNPILWGVVG